MPKEILCSDTVTVTILWFRGMDRNASRSMQRGKQQEPTPVEVKEEA